LEFYKKLDFAHNVEHMQKTIKIAEFIAKKEKANLMIVRLGAMVHQFHDDIDKLQSFLNKMGLEADIAKKLIWCAKFRPFKDTTKKNVCLEAKVVFDADALQVLGPNGIMREIMCNIKIRNKPWRKSIEDARKIEKLFYKSLQTKTAKQIIKKNHELMKGFWKIYDKWNEKF